MYPTYPPPPSPMVHVVGTNEVTMTLIPENALCWHLPYRPREMCIACECVQHVGGQDGTLMPAEEYLG